MSGSRKRVRARSISKKKSVSKPIPKAKPKPLRSPFLKSFSSWFASAATARDLRERQHRLTDGLKKVRAIYAGFGAAQGYDLRYLRHWPDARVQELLRYVQRVNRLTSGESYEIHQVVRPRTAAQRQALRLHTSQVSIDEERHPQRGFVIYRNEVVPARVRYVEEEVLEAAPMGRPVRRRRLRVEIREAVKGNARLVRNYLFREVLGFQPGLDSASSEGLRIGQMLGTFNPWDQMVIAMRRLVPRLPAYAPSGDEAQYRLLTDRGPIGSRVPRHMLVDEMQRWGEEYDSATFVGTLIGVRSLGMEEQAREIMVEASERGMRYRTMMEEQHKALSRIDYRGTLTPLHLPPKKRRKSKSKSKRAPKSRRKSSRVRKPVPKKKRARRKSARRHR